MLNANHAVFVENISDVKNEMEIIFPCGTEFLIEDIQKSEIDNKK